MFGYDGLCTVLTKTNFGAIRFHYSKQLNLRVDIRVFPSFPYHFCWMISFLFIQMGQSFNYFFLTNISLSSEGRKTSPSPRFRECGSDFKQNSTSLFFTWGHCSSIIIIDMVFDVFEFFILVEKNILSAPKIWTRIINKMLVILTFLYFR